LCRLSRIEAIEIVEQSVEVWLQEVLDASVVEHAASEAIKQGAGQWLLGEELSAICLALDYHRGHAVDVEDPFGPLWSFVGVGEYPPPLRALPEQVVPAWQSTMGADPPALVRARLGHLLWILRVSDRIHHVHSAIDAYLELSRLAIRPAWERGSDLACALTLSRRIADAGRAQTCIDALIGLMEDRTDGGPGSGALVSAAALVSAGPYRPARLPELLEQLLVAFDEAILCDRVLELAELAAQDQPSRQAVADRRVTLWIQEAEHAEGIIAHAHLDRALEIANSASLADRRLEVWKLMQSVDISKDLKPLSAHVEIPREQYDEWIGHVTNHSDPAIAFGIFSSYIPAQSDEARALGDVQEQMSEFPLQYLFNRTVLNESGLPIRQILTQEQHLQAALDQQETMRIQIWAISASDVLDALLQRWPDTSVTPEIPFPENLLPPGSAVLFGESLSLHAEGRHRAALGVLLPAIEAAVRALTADFGYEVYTVAPDGSAQPRALGALLSLLSAHLDRGLHRYLTLALTDAFGINLRNRALHGSMTEVQAQDSALALHIAIVLSHLERGPMNSPREGV
jgi:hypothetical protein